MMNSVLIVLAAALVAQAQQCVNPDAPDFNFSYSCCTNTSPCPLGAGDCDIDSNCAGTRVCLPGSDNCAALHPGAGYPADADCCIELCAAHTKPGWSFDVNCCQNQPCPHGAGDCDSDSQCLGDLICASNNCERMYPGRGDPPGADCCVAECADHRRAGWVPDPACCTPEQPCPYGEGDCDVDADCAGDLVCGSNTCTRLNPGTGFTETYDCCIQECADHTRSGWVPDPACCTPDLPCMWGEGDCDSDNDCVGDLVCGINTCTRLHPGTGFTETYDCCIEECADHTRAGWVPDPACCTPERPCTWGEGDCDSDNDCAGDLICGINTCRRLHAGTDFTETYDCCINLCADSSRSDWVYQDECCTPQEPCTLGEGDCDTNADCGPGLDCINALDNCPNGGGFPAAADCCFEPVP